MDFQVPRIVHEEVDEQRGRFTIEPLDRGFGYTFGNSLRRVLLSVARGRRRHLGQARGNRARVHDAAGREGGRDRHHPAAQEHDRPPRGRVPEIEVRLNKKGPGKVTAGDIEAPADLGDPELRTSRSQPCPTRAGSS
jgi:DNA-directed RNA polymerase subunit alpha